MRAHASPSRTSRWLLIAAVAALLHLAFVTAVAHPDHSCADESCTILQCDMAAGNGCGSLCAHAVTSCAGAKPAPAQAATSLSAGPDTGPGLRLPDRPFRPPALC